MESLSSFIVKIEFKKKKSRKTWSNLNSLDLGYLQIFWVRLARGVENGRIINSKRIEKWEGRLLFVWLGVEKLRDRKSEFI